jgi:hypothetical protein
MVGYLLFPSRVGSGTPLRSLSGIYEEDFYFTHSGVPFSRDSQRAIVGTGTAASTN